MDQTEKYLNSILTKRLGSVVNQSAFTKNASTVARLPLQEQPIDKMPTVFRKKYETVLIEQQTVSRQSKMALVMESKTASTDRQPVESHRVEYMAISKRLSMKKNEEYISPTVDVDKYQTKLKRANSPELRVNSSQMPEENDGNPIRLSEGLADNGTRNRRRKIFS